MSTISSLCFDLAVSGPILPSVEVFPDFDIYAIRTERDVSVDAERPQYRRVLSEYESLILLTEELSIDEELSLYEPYLLSPILEDEEPELEDNSEAEDVNQTFVTAPSWTDLFDDVCWEDVDGPPSPPCTYISTSSPSAHMISPSLLAASPSMLIIASPVQSQISHLSDAVRSMTRTTTVHTLSLRNTFSRSYQPLRLDSIPEADENLMSPLSMLGNGRGRLNSGSHTVNTPDVALLTVPHISDGDSHATLNFEPTSAIQDAHTSSHNMDASAPECDFETRDKNIRRDVDATYAWWTLFNTTEFAMHNNKALGLIPMSPILAPTPFYQVSSPPVSSPLPSTPNQSCELRRKPRVSRKGRAASVFKGMGARERRRVGGWVRLLLG